MLNKLYCSTNDVNILSQQQYGQKHTYPKTSRHQSIKNIPKRPWSARQQPTQGATTAQKQIGYTTLSTHSYEIQNRLTLEIKSISRHPMSYCGSQSPFLNKSNSQKKTTRKKTHKQGRTPPTHVMSSHAEHADPQ
jgi:hypothetical protein